MWWVGPLFMDHNFILTLVNLTVGCALDFFGERDDGLYLRVKWRRAAVASGAWTGAQGCLPLPASLGCQRPGPLCCQPSWDSGGLSKVSRDTAGFIPALCLGSGLCVDPAAAMWWLVSSTAHRICDSFWKLYCEMLLSFSAEEVFASVWLLVSFKCECAFL